MIDLLKSLTDSYVLELKNNKIEILELKHEILSLKSELKLMTEKLSAALFEPKKEPEDSEL